MPPTDPSVSPDEDRPVLTAEDPAGVLTIALNRPARRNAIDLATVTALREAVASADALVVVLRSAHAGMFCAGADLTIPDRERADVSRALYLLYGELLHSPSLFIAAVDGPAVGGGAQLAVACDMRVAGPAASIRFVGPGHGLAVGAWALPSLIGRGRAVELCLSCTRVSAKDALAMGLIDRLAEDPGAAAAELAAQWAALDAGAVRRVKAIVSRASTREAALALEAEGNAAWKGAGP